MKKYRNTIEFEVEGPYALFSDPVMRVGGEKTSYHIPTYEALKEVLFPFIRQLVCHRLILSVCRLLRV